MKHWFLNVKQAYKNLPIARKMSFTTILVMSLFLCMITAISATISSEILIRNNSKAASRNLELIRLRTEDLLDNAEQFSGIVVSNYYIQRSLTVADQSTRYQYDQLVGSILDPITSTRSSVSSIVVYGQDGRAVSSSNVRTSDPSVQEEYKKYAPTMAGEWNHLFWDDIHDLSYETGSEETNRGVSLRRNIISINDGSIAGFVVLNVNDHIFTDLYMDLTTEDGIHMMIVDSSGNIISSSDTKANPVRLADTPYFQWMQETRNGSRRFTVDNEKYLINTCYLERFNWYLISLCPLDVLLKDSRQAIRLSLLFGVILLFSAFAFASYLSKTITVPLRRLSQTMDEVSDGNLNTYLEPYGMDEVGHLTMNFNRMVKRMKKLMDQTFFEQKKKRKYELQALQTQINPHFLYNTLESICALIVLGRNTDAHDMVANLASFYRMVLGKGETILTLRSELEITEQYIAIQKVRYAEDLTFSMQIDQQVLDCPIMKLTLQPLVENAIYHGIKPKGSPGTIRIRAVQNGANFFVTVEDDGVGMDSSQVEMLNRPLKEGEIRKGFGVRSVGDRIKLYFGPEYGIRIFSKPGSGTQIEIHIPREA